MGETDRTKRVAGAGVWASGLRYGDPGAIAAAVGELDSLGYQAVWIPDIGGDVMGAVEHLLRSAPTIGVATGILNIWMHDPADIAARRAGWDRDRQDRFTLGLGASHAPLVDRDHPGRYVRPYSAMVRFLDALDAAPVPFPSDARVLAALRPRMLALGGERAAGVHPYFVPVEHVARARETVGPDPVIAVELAVVLDRDPASARSTARAYCAGYLALENYANNLRDLGYSAEDLSDGGSDRFVDAIVAWGDDEAIARRVGEMRDAGADHVCIQVVRDDNELPVEEWRRLAPVLAGG